MVAFILGYGTLTFAPMLANPCSGSAGIHRTAGKFVCNDGSISIEKTCTNWACKPRENESAIDARENPACPYLTVHERSNSLSSSQTAAPVERLSIKNARMCYLARPDLLLSPAKQRTSLPQRPGGERLKA